MDFPREGLSSSRPPALNSANYSYWKARMRVYIMSQGERVWRSVEEGWVPPTNEQGEKKLKREWSEEEIKEADFNSKAMNSIYGAVSEETFKLISNTEIAKEAWTILCNHHEGNTIVKQSKLQMIQTQFETLKMEENENITQFNAKILDIAGAAYNLGEPFPEPKLVKKVLRSLPERFLMKVTAIQESTNLDTYKLSDLMGNLQTYELEMLQRKPNMSSKGIALQTTQSTDSDDDTQNIEETIALLTKNFNKVVKKFNKFRSKNKNFTNTNGNNSNSQPRIFENQKKGKSSQNVDGIQCYECKGYGHIQSECATYLKRKNKTYVTTLSDDSDSENENSNFVAFTTRQEEEDTTQEDIQGLFEAYTVLQSKWQELIRVNTELMQKNRDLQTEKEREIRDHQETKKELKKLQEKEKDLIERENFQETEHTDKRQSENPEMFQQRFQHRRIRCYYCHKPGHIKAHCWFRQNYIMRRQSQTRKVWVRKNQTQTVALTSKTEKNTEIWYFDSGCSRHMTGKSEHLINILPKEGGHVTFGDGGKGQIIGSGTLNVTGLPQLTQVFLVKGLKANLISISQLCDDNLQVKFSKDSCHVYDQNNQCMMQGNRS
ncbi:PREDICTED: uncharacterized protein LOC109154740 [Ipomoea nil]|uniref:uncharacterized protein LOC109154740 n=1 Tax=Ipomoea nil TaxID=35883 RepID=UPI000901FA3E|nr:PREDICTED: uncharacterized protein LOC109154740 [Ipomoea nil]